MSLPQENVQSYPRPPALEPVDLPLRVEFGGRAVAESRRGFRVLETHHAPTYYIHEADWAEGALRPAGGASFCEWKGRAHYFDVVAGDAVAPRAAWGYRDPTQAYAALVGTVAVYPGAMDACRVGDVAVTPQPGDFYGGWVTPNLTGIVKGGPGTRHW